MGPVCGVPPLEMVTKLPALIVEVPVTEHDAGMAVELEVIVPQVRIVDPAVQELVPLLVTNIRLNGAETLSFVSEYTDKLGVHLAGMYAIKPASLRVPLVLVAIGLRNLLAEV